MFTSGVCGHIVDLLMAMSTLIPMLLLVCRHYSTTVSDYVRLKVCRPVTYGQVTLTLCHPAPIGFWHLFPLITGLYLNPRISIDSSYFISSNEYLLRDSGSIANIVCVQMDGAVGPRTFKKPGPYGASADWELVAGAESVIDRD